MRRALPTALRLAACAASLLLAACAAPPASLRAPGPDARGPDARGPDARGPDARGPDARGPDARGPDARGPASLPPEARGFLAVADAIEPVAEAECRRVDPGRDCDFRIVVDDRPGMPPNAFQTLDRGGRPVIGVTVALLGAVRSPDELAFVMSHEASHHIAGHLGRQAAVAQQGAAVFASIAGGAEGATAESVREAGQIGALLGARSYSKEFELEADALGARVAALAGYDPVAGSQFFLRLPDPGNRFLGTHPSNAERIAAVARAMAEFGG